MSETKVPTVASVVRQALLIVEDPETADVKRLLAMVRSQYAQQGGDPQEVTENRVSSVRSKIRKRFGSPITKAKVRQYDELVPGRQPRSVPAPSAARNAVGPSVQAPKGWPMTLTLEEVRVAKEFVRKVGGTEEARALIELLEEARK